MKNSKNQHGFGFIGVLAIIVCLGITSVASWYVYTTRKVHDKNMEEAASSRLPEAGPAESSKELETTPKPLAEERLSANWLLRESRDASIKVPDGFNILAASNEPVNFFLPNDQGELKYQKGTKAQVVGEIHKHFSLGLLAGYNSTGLNDLGKYERSFQTYSGLNVEVKLYVQQETNDVPAFPIGSKYLKYKVSKDSDFFTVDYIYEGEGIVEIIDEMVKTIVIK